MAGCTNLLSERQPDRPHHMVHLMPYSRPQAPVQGHVPAARSGRVSRDRDRLPVTGMRGKPWAAQTSECGASPGTAAVTGTRARTLVPAARNGNTRAGAAQTSVCGAAPLVAGDRGMESSPPLTPSWDSRGMYCAMIARISWCIALRSRSRYAT